ncbi:RidA family protein [Euzebya tangerina]|uniref:RidA family protein n=1 Tax=Euzebya tangerina TaxID=591198 RepID=UPI000E30D01E|nr:RidA family protein [Euzebya tangerina]
MSAEARLRELGIHLPDARPAAGNYIPFRRHGDLLFLAGQGADGHVGRVGDTMTLEEGQAAARAAGLNLLTQTRAALGTLDAVEEVVRVHGWVSCADGFTQIPAVVNGASDLFVEVFGDAGRHARTAVGVWMLPLGFAVEVEMIVAVRDGAGGAYRHAL